MKLSALRAYGIYCLKRFLTCVRNDSLRKSVGKILRLASPALAIRAFVLAGRACWYNPLPPSGYWPLAGGELFEVYICVMFLDFGESALRIWG